MGAMSIMLGFAWAMSWGGRLTVLNPTYGEGRSHYKIRDRTQPNLRRGAIALMEVGITFTSIAENHPSCQEGNYLDTLSLYTEKAL
jgi:hypothetical protein